MRSIVVQDGAKRPGFCIAPVRPACLFLTEMRHGDCRSGERSSKDMKSGFEFKNDSFTVVTGGLAGVGEMLEAESASKEVVGARSFAETVVVTLGGKMEVQNVVLRLKEAIHIFEVRVLVLRKMAGPIRPIGNDQ